MCAPTHEVNANIVVTCGLAGLVSPILSCHALVARENVAIVKLTCVGTFDAVLRELRSRYSLACTLLLPPAWRRMFLLGAAAFRDRLLTLWDACPQKRCDAVRL